MKAPWKMPGSHPFGKIIAKFRKRRSLVIGIAIGIIALAFCFAIITKTSQPFAIWKFKQFFNIDKSQEFNRNEKNYNDELQILDQNRVIAIFKVAIANDDEKRRHGLMNLDKLAKDKGMLFVFDQKQTINMWMKNTLIPLDIIFVDELGMVVNIREDANPNSLELINSGSQIDRVIEINAGLVSEFGIKLGNQIILKQNL